MKIFSYHIHDSYLHYIVDESCHVSLFLIPESKNELIKKNWEITAEPLNPCAKYNKNWCIGSIAHIHLHHHNSCSANGVTLKEGKSFKDLKFINQNSTENKFGTLIETVLNSEEGYRVIHKLQTFKDYSGFKVSTSFENLSDKTLRLDMISSFALDNLSPFYYDDAPNQMHLHRFRGGWSLEGRHVSDSIEHLGLEKPWFGNFRTSEKFGSIGSHPTSKFFPLAVVEDRGNNTFWAASLNVPGSWQMELTRVGDTLSFTGGFADAEYGDWYKFVSPGETVYSAEAYIAVSDKDLPDACNRITQLYNIPCNVYGEKEPFALQYNEFCTTWGEPTQEKILSYGNFLKSRGFNYLVIDAGWSKGCYEGQRGNGVWDINTDIFPDMKRMCKEIRSMGMIPGIWFEFEVVTAGSPLYGKPEHIIKKDGIVVNCAGWRTFWDFRDSYVTDNLTKKVICMLKENGFGYIKNDYNGSIGIGCDGSNGLGANLNDHLFAVGKFFEKIKQEIPDIVIENCASGGHRSTPYFMGLTALTSFSDAHECKEIPYIAANLHNLMLPRQELIWAVIHHNDTIQRIIYSICATFFGRICLSGDITKLSEDQWKLIDEGVAYYNQLHDILLNGVTRIYGNRSASMRYATGTQVAIRENQNQILIIVHAFKNPTDEINVELPKGFKIKCDFNGENIILSGNNLKINKMPEYSAGSLLLEKE